MVTVRPATLADIQAISPRPQDVAELWNVSHHTPEEAMRYGIENGPAWIGALNGEPLGIFGVVPVERVGCIWAVFTELTEGHPMTFLRACREPLKQLQSEYDMLVNYVDAANTKVISWLTWLGFRMEKPAPFGIERKPFRRFEWRRNV